MSTIPHDPPQAMEIALRARLCLAVLQTRHANAFHLGNMVRIAFVVAYLACEGLSDASHDNLIRIERLLSDTAARATRNGDWQLSGQADAVQVAILLDAYEAHIVSLPVEALRHARHRVEANFAASPDRRRSIQALLTGV